MNSDLHFDYTTVGHVTVDVLEDGARRPGGGAFYSALQAARLGRRTLILTRGVAREIEELLEPYRDELDVTVLPAAHTTTLQTSGTAAARSQRVLAWAGPIEPPEVATSILHLAPVARETPARWSGRADFVGLTPQGLARQWSAEGAPGDGAIRAAPPAPEAETVARHCDAIVLDERERASCAGLIAAAGAAGAVVAVTAGERPNTIVLPGGALLEVTVPPVSCVADDLGAGDVFAAAFFTALADDCRPADAARFANAAAAVRMHGDGADAIGGRAAIEARLGGG